MEGFERFRRMTIEELKTCERGTLAVLRNIDEEERPFNCNAEKAFGHYWEQLDAIREEIASKENPKRLKPRSQYSSNPRIKQKVRPIYARDFKHIDGEPCLF